MASETSGSYHTRSRKKLILQKKVINLIRSIIDLGCGEGFF